MDSRLVTCKNCGDEHRLDERRHWAASSFCPECQMRGGYVLNEADEQPFDVNGGDRSA